MAKDVGYWVDLDLVFLKPFDFKGRVRVRMGI